MTTETIECERCGGPMVPGIPGDVYCPKAECMDLDMKAAFAMVSRMRENERRKQYEELKKEFDDE